MQKTACATTGDPDLAVKLAEQYFEVCAKLQIAPKGTKSQVASVLYDVMLNAPKVRLGLLLGAEGFRINDIVHDLGGILRNWNPGTKQFDYCFAPRCTRD